MKILFIVPYVPSLVRVRPYNLIRYLVQQEHEVTLATLYSNVQEETELKILETQVKRVLADPLPTWQSLWNVVRAIPSRQPLQSVYSWNPRLYAQINQLLSDPEVLYDVIHVEHLRGANYGIALQDAAVRRQIPIIWDSVDNISYLFKQSAIQSKSWINRWITRFEVGRTQQYESWLVRQFARVLVTSPNDRQAFLDLHPDGAGLNRVQVLPNGVDLDYFTPDLQVAREPATLVVSGKMSYHANITMVSALVEEIMPLIWQSIPDVRLQIVGKDPPPQLQALSQDSRIIVTGTVPDIRPYLRGATLAVAPVPYGAGIQNKVLEAMACATPVVTSAKAISALSTTPGVHLLVANQPRDFANQVVHILQNADLRAQIGQAGLEYVQRYHNWNSIVAQLVGIYQRAMEKQ